MNNRNKVNNPKARFWKKSQLNLTVKQCKAAGFQVEKEGDGTTIINPENGDIVLRSLYTGQAEMVRLDSSYFQS